MGNSLNLCIERKETNKDKDHDNGKECYFSDCCMKREIRIIDEHCDCHSCDQMKKSRINKKLNRNE